MKQARKETPVQRYSFDESPPVTEDETQLLFLITIMDYCLKVMKNLVPGVIL
jgi:hypothetical protein